VNSTRIVLIIGALSAAIVIGIFATPGPVQRSAGSPTPSATAAAPAASAAPASAPAATPAATSPRPAIPDEAPPSDWTTTRGTPDLRGVAAPLATPLQKRWTWEAGSGLAATALIKDGAVYAVTARGVVARLDLASGREVWRHAEAQDRRWITLTRLRADLAALPAGPGEERTKLEEELRKTEATPVDPAAKPEMPSYAGPVLADGLILLGDSDGVMRAIDAASGALRWKTWVGGPVTAAAGAASGMVLVGTDSNQVKGLSLGDGTERWTFTSDNYIRSIPCVIGSEAVVAGCDGAIRALALADGKERILGGADHFGSSPARLGQSLLIGSIGGEILAVGIKDEQTAWRQSPGMGKILITPAAAPTMAVFVGEDGSVLGVDPANGEERWRIALESGCSAAPVIAGDLVWLGSNDGVLHAFNLADGKERWTWKAGGGISHGVAIAGGWLLLGTDDGALHAFTATSPASP
jgi:outer membrane protein assembly factor BamB